MKKERFYNPLHLRFSFLVFIFIIAAACRKKDAVQPIVAMPPADTTAYTIDTTKSKDTSSEKSFLALGDSYTIGQSVDSSERFPAQTAALLRKQNITLSPIQYIATTGWTTINLMNAVQQQKPQGTFAAVSLLIGVNDEYQFFDTTGYRSRFTALLDLCVSFAGNRKSHVFVLSIPDYGVTPFGGNRKEISDQINLFNAINKDVTLHYGISYTNVTTISRSDAGDAGDASMIAPDGLHPSGKQYAQWAQALDSAMLKVLR